MKTKTKKSYWKFYISKYLDNYLTTCYLLIPTTTTHTNYIDRFAISTTTYKLSLLLFLSIPCTSAYTQDANKTNIFVTNLRFEKKVFFWKPIKQKRKNVKEKPTIQQNKIYLHIMMKVEKYIFIYICLFVCVFYLTSSLS